MDGAAHLPAVFVLAQTLGICFPAKDPWLRLATAGLAGPLVLHANGHTWGESAFVPVLSIAFWALLHAAFSKWLRSEWMRRSASEAAFGLIAVSATMIAQPDAIAIVHASARFAVGPRALLSASVYLLTIVGGDQLIRRVVAPFAPAASNTTEETPGAGRRIGWLERTLIVTLVAGGYIEPVGWLLGAKAAIRYPEIRDKKTELSAEYFLIGTMLSTLIAIVGGLVLQIVLGLSLAAT